ncbi:MAG: glycosyltransferase family 2 protein [Oscillospiraceae bacterium]|jgi:glycosyltransferase involved in cell wall biosynthesis|nr:glycosyltransferase family 2 protein [Oscillospiraceae bacterium]
MKARISDVLAGAEGLTLSVGMIVKNEEKHLEKCLAALKPLLDAVPSELVVVDTGSEDRTVEIARAFTERVEHFDWVNDFSAARNFCLSKCSGEWFMFLDGDDILDADLSDIIGFFTNEGERSRYNTATYCTRDYLKPDGSAWTVFAQSRVIKRFNGLRFQGAIHEHFAAFPEPTRRLKTISHHWGYAYETEEQKQAKYQRNLTISLRELKKKPNDLRLRMSIANIIEPEERSDFIGKSVEMARKMTTSSYAAPTFISQIKLTLGERDGEGALAYIDEYFRLFGRLGKNVLTLEVYALKVMALCAAGKMDEAKKALEGYVELYELDKNGGLNDFGTGLMVLLYNQPEGRAKVEMVCNRMLTSRAPFSFDVDRLVATVIHVEQRLTPAEELVGALEARRDISGAVRGMDYEEIEKNLVLLSHAFPNLPYLAAKYDGERFLVKSVKNLLFAVALYKAALPSAAALGEGDRAALYEKFASYAAIYAENVCNPAVLNETDAAALPEACRFGYYVGAAKKALEGGDKAGYVRRLKDALDSCKFAHGVIGYLLEAV